MIHILLSEFSYLNFGFPGQNSDLQDRIDLVNMKRLYFIYFNLRFIELSYTK